MNSEYEQYERKLDEWEAEGYDVSEFRERWFPSRKAKGEPSGGYPVAERRPKIRSIPTLVLAMAVVALVIIGLLDFDLMLEIWVKVLIGIIFAGVMFMAVKQFWGRGKNKQVELEYGKGGNQMSGRDRGYWGECPKCFGSGRVECERCGGSGKLMGAWHIETCPRCHGTGEMKCDYPGCRNGRIWVCD